MFSIHQTAELRKFCRELRIDPQALRGWRSAYYRKGARLESLPDLLPEGIRTEVARQVQLSFLDIVQRQDSALDGATKLAFGTVDGHRVESVILRIRSGRTSLCVSTQVGCAAGCRFCATGTGGLIRNLSTDEILDQVVQAQRLLRQEGLALRNVVFMGMGEPFHNEANLYAALDRLLAPDGFNLSPRKLMVSTFGVPDAMERFAARYPQVGMAVSLHSARADVRRQLMPLASRYSLMQLREAMVRSCAAKEGPIMIEYLLLRGVNDGPDDLAALVEYLGDLPSHINLIPLNGTVAATNLAGTPEPERQAFARLLRAAGFTVTMRRSLGSDIDAACGQLAAKA